MNGINIHGEKPTKFFYNFEKQNAINTTVSHLITDHKDITDFKDINVCVSKFYKNLFKKNISKSDSERESFLTSVVLPNLKILTYVKVKLQEKT